MDNETRKLISILQENCRLRIKDIARRLSRAPTTVTSRIYALEREGVVAGYSVILDHAKIGYPQLLHTHIKCRSQSNSAVSSLLEFLEQFREILEIHKVYGETWDIFLKIRIPSTASGSSHIVDSLSNHPNVDSVSTTVVMETVRERISVPLEEGHE